MKQMGRLILASLLAIMMVLPFVMAATSNSLLQDFGEKIFGFTGFGTPNEAITQLMVWLILFVAFSDILQFVFSDLSRWLIGLALAVIAANTGLIGKLSVFLFSFAAGLGAFSIAAVISITFIAFLLVHFGIGWAYNLLSNARKQQALRTAKFKIASGARTLADVSTVMEKIGEPTSIIKWIIIIAVIIILLLYLFK